jgi:hypothetical protein
MFSCKASEVPQTSTMGHPSPPPLLPPSPGPPDSQQRRLKTLGDLNAPQLKLCLSSLTTETRLGSGCADFNAPFPPPASPPAQPPPKNQPPSLPPPPPDPPSLPVPRYSPPYVPPPPGRPACEANPESCASNGDKIPPPAPLAPPPAPCEPGTYFNNETGCAQCPEGMYCEGAERYLCRANTYRDSEGGQRRTDCKRCPLLMTSPAGSTSASDCRCNQTGYCTPPALKP